MQLTPDGDCREASFTAKGAGLRVPPLSAVQIEYLSPSGWTPLYYGEVRQGGNARDVNGETYILRSLALRLKEVTLPPDFKAPKQPAHLTVRAIIQAVLPRLAGSVLYDAALCPDMGFDCREIKAAHQQTPWAFLEQIAEDGAGMGVTVAWGVRPDRAFFCQPARADTVVLSESETIALQWKPPVAETPCTAVLWFVASVEWLNGEGQKESLWVTHLTRSPLADQHGERVKPLPLPPGIEAWEPVGASYELVEFTGVTPTRRPLTPEEIAPLTDGQRTTGAPSTTLTSSAASLAVEVTPDAPAHRLVYAGQIGGTGLRGWVPYSQLPEPGAWGIENMTLTSYQTGYAAGEAPRPEAVSPAGAPLRLGVALERLDPFADPQPPMTLELLELRPERINTALLDRLAQYHYSVPAQEPADIELRTYRAPADLAGRVTLSDYTRAVDAWEYRLTAGRGLTLAALTGQADDPAKLAQAALIKARDGQATITALTAQT